LFDKINLLPFDVTRLYKQSPYSRQGHKRPLHPPPSSIADRLWVALAYPLTRGSGVAVILFIMLILAKEKKRKVVFLAIYIPSMLC